MHSRYLVKNLGLRVTVVPWDYDFTQDDFDGLFLSNGPGNPTMCAKTVEHVQYATCQPGTRVETCGRCPGIDGRKMMSPKSILTSSKGHRGLRPSRGVAHFRSTMPVWPGASSEHCLSVTCDQSLSPVSFMLLLWGELPT